MKNGAGIREDCGCPCLLSGFVVVLKHFAALWYLTSRESRLRFLVFNTTLDSIILH